MARLEALEIPPLEAALDRAIARGRQDEARRLRRQLASARGLLLKTDARLTLSASHATAGDLGAALRAIGGGRP
jgi:hypothetical protein